MHITVPTLETHCNWALMGVSLWNKDMLILVTSKSYLYVNYLISASLNVVKLYVWFLIKVREHLLKNNLKNMPPKFLFVCFYILEAHCFWNSMWVTNSG